MKLNDIVIINDQQFGVGTDPGNNRYFFYQIGKMTPNKNIFHGTGIIAKEFYSKYVKFPLCCTEAFIPHCYNLEDLEKLYVILNNFFSNPIGMQMDNDIQIDGAWCNLPKILKRLGFVDDLGFYTRSFTRIYVIQNELYIGHTISNRKLKIEFENLDIWIKYFDRI